MKCKPGKKSCSEVRSLHREADVEEEVAVVHAQDVLEVLQNLEGVDQEKILMV